MPYQYPTSVTSPAASERLPLDREGFDTQVQPHLDAMHASARRVTRCDHAAWDAVQEVLLRLWSRGWLPDEPRGALCHLARKAALQQLRAQRRRCHHEACAAAPTEACLFSTDDDPGVAELAAEQRRQLHHEVRRLDEPFRRTLQLHAFEGLDYAELASELAVPVGTVRSRLHRARRSLKRRLQPAGTSVLRRAV